MKSKQAAFEIRFFERLAKADPTNIRVLVALAENYSGLGDYGKSLPIDRRLTYLRPEKSVFWYNLACSYARLEDADSAFESLEVAVKNGYDDVLHMCGDPDLESIRSDPRFRVIARSCRERRRKSLLQECRRRSESAE